MTARSWLIRGLIGCISVCAAASAFSQSYEPMARLSLTWETRTGPTWIWLLVDEGDDATLQEAFRRSFGCVPTEEDVRDPYDPVEVALWAECPDLAVRDGLSLEVRLDLKELSGVLRRGGIRYLSVTLSHRRAEFTKIEGLADFEETRGWGHGHHVYYDVDLQADDPEPVLLEMGYGDRYVLTGTALLTFVLILPIVLTVRHRSKVLGRDSTASDDTSWFAHWRFFHWLSLGIFFAWVVFFLAFSFWGVLGFLLAGWDDGLTNVLRLGLLFLPPFSSVFLCQLISAPVLDHIRGKKGIGRRMVRASQLGTAMMVLPLMFVMVGVVTCFTIQDWDSSGCSPHSW